MKGGVKFGETTVAYVNEINKRLQESNEENNNEFNLTPRNQLTLNNESVKENVKSARGILKNSSESFNIKQPSFLNKLRGNRKSRSKNPRKKSSSLSRRGFNQVPTASKYSQKRAYRDAKLMENNVKQNGGLPWRRPKSKSKGGSKKMRKTKKLNRKTRRVTKKRGRKSRKN